MKYIESTIKITRGHITLYITYTLLIGGIYNLTMDLTSDRVRVSHSRDIKSDVDLGWRKVVHFYI